MFPLAWHEDVRLNILRALPNFKMTHRHGARGAKVATSMLVQLVPYNFTFRVDDKHEHHHCVYRIEIDKTMNQNRIINGHI